LIDEDRPLGNHQRLVGLQLLDDHPDELVVEERALGFAVARVGDLRPDRHRIGRRLDPDVDEVDRPALAVERAVRMSTASTRPLNASERVISCFATRVNVTSGGG
jgi:hypothetical protein